MCRPAPASARRQEWRGVTAEQQRNILGIIDQLLKYTDQLSRCGETEGMDAAALSRAFEERAAALREALPIGALAGLGKDAEEVVEQLKILEERTRLCSTTLEKCLDRADDRLSTFRNTRKAINAYRGAR